VRNRAHVTRLLGETVREAGILISVLAPLDAAFGSVEFDIRLVLAAIVLGAILVVSGIFLETRS
jgi:hypothetical protein